MAPLASWNVREPSRTARTRLDSPCAAARLPNAVAMIRSDSVRTQNASAFSASANPPASAGVTRSPRTPTAASVIARSVRYRCATPPSRSSERRPDPVPASPHAEMRSENASRAYGIAIVAVLPSA